MAEDRDERDDQDEDEDSPQGRAEKFLKRMTGAKRKGVVGTVRKIAALPVRGIANAQGAVSRATHYVADKIEGKAR